MPRIVFVGLSHTQAVRDGCRGLGIACAWPSMNPLSGESHIRYGEGGKEFLNSHAEGVISNVLEEGDILVSLVGGNAHNVIGLIEIGTPIDFYSPETHFPPDSGREIYPYEVIRSSMQARLTKGDFRLLEAAKSSFPRIVVHVESPPPLRSNLMIEGRLDSYFREIPNYKISPPAFRLKMYKMHSSLYKQKCEALGLKFVSAPTEAIDDDGFLKPEFGSEASATHSNVEYGKLVGRQLLELLL